MGLEDQEGYPSGAIPDGSNNITKNTLHLTENTTFTQLDIEESEHTMSGHTEGTDDDDYDNDDDDLPPLATYLSGWKFWCQFAIYPFVFLILNGVVVSTLVVFSEYDFKHGRRHSRNYDEYDIYSDDSFNNNYDGSSRGRNSGNVHYDMVKYNRIIIAILLFIDALIVYRAVTYLDKKVRELDMIGVVNDDEHGDPYPTSPSPSIGITPNIHAQVSRKLDVVMGRNPQSRVSILVSLLWVLFVACGTVSLVSVADLLFTISPQGVKVCKGTATATSDTNDGDDPTNESTKKIPDIPDALQDWAQNRNDWIFMGSSGNDIAHLTNGVTYVAASDPQKNKTASIFSQDRTQLVSIGPDGTIEFHKDVLSPMSFTSFSGDNLLSSTGFCCVYNKKPQQNSEGYDPYSSQPAVLCVDLQTNRTVTLLEKSSSFDNSFEGASIKAYNNVIWVQVMTSSYNPRNGNMKSVTTFYNASVETDLKLMKVTEQINSDRYGGFGGSDFSDQFFIGPGSKCYRWTRTIDTIVFIIVLGGASAWLTVVKNLSVGIVPAIAAACITFTRINHGLSFAIVSISAVVVFIGLLGYIPIPMHREKLIWTLYTLLFCVEGLLFSGRSYMYYDGGFYNFACAMVTIVTVSFIGFILDHPVLYLFGWIGAIWAVLGGLLLLFTPPHIGGLLAMTLGIIMGAGCATIGYNLIKYRVPVVHYSKRAWMAMNAAMQSNNGGRSNNRIPNNSTTATRYTPVVHTPQHPIVDAHDPGRRGNGITAGLLNQNSEG